MHTHLTRAGILVAFLEGTALVHASTITAPAAAQQAFPMAKCKGHVLEDASITQIQGWYASGNLSVKDVVGCYLTRIYQLNKYVG